MEFRNDTELDSEYLRRLFLRHTYPYRHDRLRVRVRYSRGADFSGTCFYHDALIYVNLGRLNDYPYTMGTHLAKACGNRLYWWRQNYRVVLRDAYQLVLFVYLHELYHYLLVCAGRSPRRKEAMCDRFAARVLVDCFECPVLDGRGRPVPRESWDFRDLDAFVARAERTDEPLARPREIPVRIHDTHAARPAAARADAATVAAAILRICDAELASGLRTVRARQQLLLPWGEVGSARPRKPRKRAGKRT